MRIININIMIKEYIKRLKEEEKYKLSMILILPNNTLNLDLLLFAILIILMITPFSCLAAPLCGAHLIFIMQIRAKPKAHERVSF